MKNIKEPKFRPELVWDQLREAYWLEAPDVDGDSRPDIVGYGLTMGEIYWYKNESPKWTRNLALQGMKMPIGMDFADITGDGFADIVICYDLYGAKGRIDDPAPLGGKIDWLENPGNNPGNIQWKRHYIGQEVGMHRLRVGHFSQSDKWEVFGAPIVGLNDVFECLPIALFTEPEDVRKEWEKEIIDSSTFRFIHEVEKLAGKISSSPLESLLIASDEGVTWMYFEEKSKNWKKVKIGSGELTQFSKTGFKGAGNANVGSIGDDNFAYVVSVEPFHGNTLAVYCKPHGVPPQVATWKRIILDVFGDPNELGEGPCHHVVCADFDGDGDDEFLVALRGPYPWQGVFYYKAIDAENGQFLKWRVSSESTARISVGDFTGNGKLDFATIGYKVKHYYEAEDAKVMLFVNEF
ncbi:FG-GAP repeat domain-containing protein [Synechococcus lacustris]|uniref:FG-GAP repeat domain-containing protein n=2 Tax=Synechococcus lacustris TaxID=2116544 RepID=UPI0020CE1D27|nr:VCBS repeat-containing protein [Synechococcus lacustris]MCP9814953.1 VCBS repeat-containing protein [Synechococcus lacustris L1E-Slac]MCP9926204.1 VCBS repeat-containing protein [Synechococcus lacustris C3-12m-Tous]